MLYSAAHCLGHIIHKVTSKHPRRQWQHLIPQDLYVPMPVHGSIHHQLTPPPMVDCTPYHDAKISIIRLDAGINQPLPLPMAHPDRPSLWYRENRDSSLIQCLHCLRSHTPLLPHSRRRRLCSNVSLAHLAGRRDQYPVRSRLRMVGTDIRLPNRWIICICRRGAETWVCLHYRVVIWVAG